MNQISRKVVLLGPMGAGKTSLIRRFVFSTFSENYLTTIGVKVDKKLVELPERKVNLLIWDIAGEITIQKVPQTYLLGAHGIFYVLDLYRLTALAENCQLDIQWLQTNFPQVPLVLVGNKSDLITPEIQQTIQNLNFQPNFITSAKTGAGVEEAFIHLARLM
ncbi:MAG: GTP-binding protein [Bacteroidia bacterium]|nr:GTP-binding protein [Bacteroidia bacterium]